VHAQARKQAEAIEISMRMDRLAQQASESMVTTNTLASMDEDDDTALKRFNIILKASRPTGSSLTHPCSIVSNDGLCCRTANSLGMFERHGHLFCQQGCRLMRLCTHSSFFAGRRDRGAGGCEGGAWIPATG
jgi:hypothetical protein